MKNVLLTVVLMLFCAFAFGQAKYHFTIDLLHVADDKISVELIPPALKKNEVVYNLPKIVPGTYSEDDFGRYIENFEALDKNGQPLPVEQMSTNSWKVRKAKKLGKIRYKVNDTFDDFGDNKKVFEPCGSNIQRDTNYLLNNHCFAGYFDGMKQIPFQLRVIHPDNIYGSTALDDVDVSATSDLFEAENYNRLVDSPLMYGVADTATIMIGNSAVLISVYSPNKVVSAAFLAGKIDKLLQAQGAYLGGVLPVKKYAFLVYLNDKGGVSGAQGALEHSYSSVYFMPEGNDDNTVQFFMDVAAHEFFHILTPLNIHSEEIHYFDFNTPKMSKHLWLYEGTTEYHAHLVQEKYGLTTKEDFLQVLQQKITTSRQRYIDTLPFTVMSANCLDTYANQYGNVYQKGALIAMCLDIKLLQLSAGKYGILNLIADLSKKYGKDQPFKDEALFAEIGKLTYPEIRIFLEKYVAGSQALPLEEILALVGVNFSPLVQDSTFTLGRISFELGTDQRQRISNLSNMNAFGKAMGYQVNDIILSLNGTEITASNLDAAILDLYKTAKVGEPMQMVVLRKNAAGVEEKVSLSAPMVKVPRKRVNVLEFDANADAEQLALRDSWLLEKK
ncbi:MAG TPA: peptidase M61 [Haliscomenobacter sp.]|uniref:M61 family metallopeptidase n=1 Tax=Haliscomenobacter sp. TaxID=2717303 RepID=UPI002C89A30F|nr:peptidase M61 [Haliscomenobacter sp.]HOY17227.1 peptidase M61 [Haliscomenobacter sp.]HPH17514.1 peptidase M61 [Haliscomenobacter sp.]